MASRNETHNQAAGSVPKEERIIPRSTLPEEQLEPTGWAEAAPLAARAAATLPQQEQQPLSSANPTCPPTEPLPCSPATSFRAIIVGAGPGGLSMAHMLERAGIDWVMLERARDVVFETGYSLAIWPQNLRVFDQLGILDEAERLYIPLRDKYNLGPSGKVLAKTNMIERIGENHGYPWSLFHRRTLLDFLLRTLPNHQGRVLTGKSVRDVRTTEHGVKVYCGDGTVVDGSIVIGCDGVHSTVRRLMRDPTTHALSPSLANTLSPPPSLTPSRVSTCDSGGLLKEDDAGATSARWARLDEGKKHPMPAFFQGLVGHFARIEAMPPETVWELHDKGLCVQLLVGARDAYFFVYKQLAKPMRGRVEYTEEDMQLLAAEAADRILVNTSAASATTAAESGSGPTPGSGKPEPIRFRDVWALRSRASMVNFEEGFAKEWHRGRMVLVSDAAVKMTPNAGFSLNVGLQGMVELTNRLVRLLRLSPSPLPACNGKSMAAAATITAATIPTASDLSRVFHEYQSARERMAKNVCHFSGGYTRTVTWANLGFRLIDYLSPMVGGDITMTDTLVASIVKRSIVLDFAEEPGFRDGRIPWRNRPLGEEGRRSGTTKPKA